MIARHLRPYFRVCAYDPAPDLHAVAQQCGVVLTSLEEAARCPVVVLALPVGRMEEVVAAVAPHIRPGSLVLDVESVKVGPAEIMKRGLPEHAEIAATHPLLAPSLRGMASRASR